MNVLKEINDRRIYFDGGFGTLLQEMGLASGEKPEEWSITHPDKIKSIHEDYLKAGADIITTNTFGLNKFKFDNVEIYVKAAIECAKEAVKGYENKYIAFDMGPTGKMIKPMGNIEFEEMVEVFAENVKCAAKYGADLIIIETMNDSYETKAALLAAKENSDLPVFVTNAYDEREKLMTGADAKTMVAILEGLGADALGINCSFGPDKMLPIVETLVEYASIPVIVNPNAGLPEIKDGKTVFSIGADEFAGIMREIAKKGALILGGCCGTTPEHIAKTIEKTKDIPVKEINKKCHTIVSSYSHTVELGKETVIIGERINPTGKTKIKNALKTEEYSYILSEAVHQEEAGAHILDVNVGIPDIDEAKTLSRLVKEIQGVTDIPLQIDTSNPIALERAMREYNGKPMVNSTNGSMESMRKVFPLIKKYGGVVVGLTMDENGIPDTAEGRYEIAKKIIEEAALYGIDIKDIVIDPLAMTLSSNNMSATVTLESIEKIKKLGVSTVLGVSNISFGLPGRDIINSNFLTAALCSGLDMAIMDPFSSNMIRAYKAWEVISGRDKGCGKYISHMEKKTEEIRNDDITLHFAIEKGFKEEAVALVKKMLEASSPIEIIDGELIPALNDVGKAFEEKRIFLPQLIMSAEAATCVFDILKEIMPNTADEKKKVAVATVKGDIHDIGKNIAKALLESYGFYVIDMGKDVDPDEVAKQAKECNLIGLSALMTTTVGAMEETIKLIKENNKNAKVLVGGAVLTEEYAKKIGADYYAKDAMDTVRIAQIVLEDK